MRIEASSLSLQSAHRATQQRLVQERLRAWTGPRPDFEPLERGRTARPTPPVVHDRVTISNAGRARIADEAADFGHETESFEGDPRLQLIISVVEMLTGRKVRFIRPEDLHVEVAPLVLTDPRQAAPAPTSAGFGLEYERQESYTETEISRFSAEGMVRTADGQEIRFKLTLSMQRDYHEEHTDSLRLGDAVQLKDPLVINFAGSAAQLSDLRFNFDLNADGQAEQINQLATGSGFLALDLNANGKVDNGKELFGPQSGDGFAELAAHDHDGNSWIDESDPIYKQLQVWTRSPDGQHVLTPLASAGVGAVSLAAIATPFELKNPANLLLGKVRASSVYLNDDGKAGTVQQIDLTA